VFVFPSAREGFGIAVLEALACGLSVVTTSAPDNLAQYLVARSPRGTICDSTAPAIAAAVKVLLGNGQSSSPGGRPSEEVWLADYSWEATTDRVVAALNI
jgi:glycosyltransferase involved in cell wall biosynthesis